MVTCVPDGTITFPMLGDGFQITAPGSFSLFGLNIHWYGILIAAGFLLAVWYAAKNSRRHFGISYDDIINILLFAVPSAIVFGRLYYVVFNPGIIHSFADIFKVWEGGIAFYGVFIGGVGAAIIYCLKKKIKVAALLDCVAPGLLMAQIVGRWGNFMNREAFGAQTDIFCRMGLTDAAGNTIFVHPTFLYESLWNLIGLFLIWLIFFRLNRRKYDGQLFAFYIGWYGMARLMIEGLRTDSLYLFGTGLRVSQILGGLCFIGAAVFLTINRRRSDGEKLYVNQVNSREKPADEAQANSDTNQAD